MKRLGNYQKVIITALRQKGKLPVQIKYGYSRQVKSLKKRKVIKQTGGYLYLTKKYHD